MVEVLDEDIAEALRRHGFEAMQFRIDAVRQHQGVLKGVWEDARTNAKLRVAESALERIADTDPDEGTAWFHDRAQEALTAIRSET